MRAFLNLPTRAPDNRGTNGTSLPASLYPSVKISECQCPPYRDDAHARHTVHNPFITINKTSFLPLSQPHLHTLVFKKQRTRPDMSEKCGTRPSPTVSRRGKNEANFKITAQNEAARASPNTTSSRAFQGLRIRIK